jgi:hypothetical protein
MARVAKPDGLGEAAGFEWSGGIIVKAELEQAIVALNDWLEGFREQPGNGRIIPGLIPGLFAAKSGLLPCFVRFSCRAPTAGKLRKPFIFKRLTGSG